MVYPVHTILCGGVPVRDMCFCFLLLVMVAILITSPCPGQRSSRGHCIATVIGWVLLGAVVLFDMLGI